MTRLVFFGAGGHARSVVGMSIWTMRDDMKTYGHAVVVDDDPATHGRQVNAYKVVGGREAIQPGDHVVNCIGNTPRVGDSGLAWRAEVFTCMLMRRHAVLSVVNDYDYMLGDYDIGVHVLPGAVVNAGAVIGVNCIVNTNATIEHGVYVGPHSHIAPGAVVCGDARIGNAVHVGANATVLPGVVIGDGAVIGAGAVVTQDVPPRATVFAPRAIVKES